MKFLQDLYGHTARTACFLLALHFFNVSMDSQDRYPDFVPEDLSINDIESIAEFLTEVVLDADNAFAEHDEHDGDAGGSFNFYKWIIFTDHPVACPELTWSPTRVEYFIKDPMLFSEGVSEVSSPPPQA